MLSCLSCRFEPVWENHSEDYADGMCRRPKPECDSRVRLILDKEYMMVSGKTGIIENCPGWEKKGNPKNWKY